MSCCRPSRCGCGTVLWYRMYLLPLIILKMPGGMSSSGCRCEEPASSTNTLAPALARRAAATQPEEPPPTTIWSNRSFMLTFPRLASGSRPNLLETAPVKFDAVARPVRRYGESFLDVERTGNVVVEPEPVCLEEAAV